MHCSHCDKSISNKSRFCMYCGKAVTPASKEPSPLIRELLPASRGMTIASHPLAGTESNWGARINTGADASDRITERPTDCPEWVENRDWRLWYRRGLVVWNNAAHHIWAISAREAVELLERLRACDEWKAQGVTLVERINTLRPENPPRPKRSRKKNSEPEPSPEQPKTEYVVHEEERLRLAGSAAEELYGFLQANEAQLRQVAEEDKKRREQAMQQVVELLIRYHHEQELKEFDATSRKFLWVRKEYPLSLICDVPPDRGTIKLCDDGFWWQSIIERPNHMKCDWERFFELKEALDWVEQKLPELRAEDDEMSRALEREEAEERAKIAALPKKDLTPYQIGPSVLEPKRITCRAIIELEYEPYTSKTTEISFGKQWRWDEEFYTPTMLARELRLSTSQVEVKQPATSIGWYYIHSATTYYEVPLATAQAQQLWEHSAIMERYEQKKVIRARYGVEEAETDYCTWLGGCENPDNPWPTPETRAEYMAHRAMRETLLYALDVNGYRQFTEAPYKYVSDEQLLERMHKARAKSAYVPTEARTESQRWLKEHAP